MAHGFTVQLLYSSCSLLLSSVRAPAEQLRRWGDIKMDFVEQWYWTIEYRDGECK